MSPLTHDRDRSEELDRKRMSHRKEIIQTLLTVGIILVLVGLCVLAFLWATP